MGLGDAISRIIIDVRAETKGARQQLHELNGAIEAMGKFTQFARDAMVEYAEHTRLGLAATGINMDKLSKSFQGLINEHDLLSFAAKTSHGAFRLTQTEMEKVGQAAVALRNRGFDLHEAVNKLTNAMVKGKAEGLDDFGLSIADADTKAGRLKNIMGELDRVIKESGSTTADYADDVTRLANEWDNATAAFKRYTVEALKQVSANDLMAKAHGMIARGQGDIDFFSRAQGFNENNTANSPLALFLGAYDNKEAQYTQWKTQQNLQSGVAKGRQNILDRDKLDPDKAKAASDKAAEAARKLAEEYAKLGQALLGVESASARKIRADEAERAGMQAEIEYIARLEQAADKQGLFAAEMKQLNDLVNAGKISWEAYSVARAEAFQANGQTDPAVDFATTKQRLAEAASGIREMQDAIAAQQKDLAAQQKAKRESFLESTFGKIEEFSAYASAFDMLTGSVTAGMDAWISGSMSAGQAVKKFIGEALKSLASQLAIEALKHGAYALASLAFHDPAGAALHAAAAGAFGAGAIAASVAAKAMGHGGADYGKAASAGGGGGASAGGKAPGAGQQQGNGSLSGGLDKSRPVVVVLGSAFDESTPRQRARTAQAAIDKALRERDE